MKQPRTSDFDPRAKERELKSSMDGFPVIEQPEQIQLPDRAHGFDRPDLPGLPGWEAPSATTGRRKIKPRHAFDIYEDQFEALRQLALEDRKQGGSGSQSAMVRDALDDYIAKARTS